MGGGWVGRAAAAGLALLATACASVDVPERAFFWPEARLAQENIVLEADPLPVGAEPLALRYARGPIGASQIRSERADAPLILFCGGNMFRRASAGGSRSRALLPLGDVIVFDYPGYGETAGPDSIANFRAVGEVVTDAARAAADAEGRRLIVWGHSLGGVMCAGAAQRARADVLVLETTTPGAKATVAQQVGLMRPFVRVRLAPALADIEIPAALEGYDGKVVVLEAGQDETLPAALSRQLARRLQSQGLEAERLVFPEARHNEVPRQPDFAARLTSALAPQPAGR